MTADPMEAVRATLRAGDEMVDVTGFTTDGRSEFMVGRRAVDIATAQLRAFYLSDKITVEQLEQGLNEIMDAA